MADVKLLTSIDGVLANISPTGIKYNIFPVEHNNAMWRVSANCQLPISLAGYFTSEARAQVAVTRFLAAKWADSDEIAAKHKSKRA